MIGDHTECAYCGAEAEWVGDSRGEPGRQFRCSDESCHMVTLVLSDPDDPPMRNYPVGDLQPGWLTIHGTVKDIEVQPASKVTILRDEKGHPVVHIVPDPDRPPVYRVQFAERDHAHLGVPATRTYRVVQELDTHWVCVDCYFEHHGLLEEYDGDREKLLSLLDYAHDVTDGLAYEEHECTLPGEDECSCNERTFSRSWCDGCGSGLGGSRHALTGWHPAFNLEALFA